MRSILIFLLLVCLAAQQSAGKKTYEGYQVYRFKVSSYNQLAVIELYNGHPEYDFWTKTKVLGKDIDVMVSPKEQKAFQEILSNNGIKYSVFVEDVQKLLDELDQEQKSVPYNRKKIDFNRYYRYQEITDYLNDLQDQYPELATVEEYGTSYEGRSLVLLKVSSGGTGKPAVFIDAGIHAREWAAPASALYLIQQLVENSAANRDLIDNVDWLIVPVSNPDGYEYSQTDERLWRKTTEPHSQCDGTDGNRNYNIHWNGTGSSTNQCSEAYRGTAPFSTPEAASIDKVERKYLSQIEAYIAVHTSAQCIVYPFSYASNTKPTDWRDLEDLANAAADAMADVRGKRFDVGNSYDLFGLSPGCSDDYNKGVLEVKYSYTFEGYSSDGFVTPPSRLSSAVKETFAGFRQVGLKLAELYKK